MTFTPGPGSPWGSESIIWRLAEGLSNAFLGFWLLVSHIVHKSEVKEIKDKITEADKKLAVGDQTLVTDRSMRTMLDSQTERLEKKVESVVNQQLAPVKVEQRALKERIILNEERMNRIQKDHQAILGIRDALE